MTNSGTREDKMEGLAFSLNLIYNFLLVLVQSALLALAGFGVMYWAGAYSAYFLVFILSASTPIGCAGIWYYYAKRKYKRMFLFYLVPLFLFASGYVLWTKLEAKILTEIHQAELNRNPPKE